MSAKSIVTTTDTPAYHLFNPKHVQYQYDVIYDVKQRFDYTRGPQYILLSGSIGSAKSVLMAWLAINHCTTYSGARCMLGRLALPDLKDTIFQTIVEMLSGTYKEGKDYFVRHESGYIKFANGSEIISRSWSDKKFKSKFRSLKLSMIVIEELTENDERYWPFFIECIGRLGRLPHIPENLFISATNPDDPSHPAYKFFIKPATKKYKYYWTNENDRHVYFSRTEQNPFLPHWYVDSLREKYDEKMCRRLLEGEWLYISTDVIYYNYDPSKHLVEGLKLRKKLPLRLTFDFNIRKGKPMSSALFQFDPYATNLDDRNRRFQFLDEVAIEGARTKDAMEEWAGKGYFDLPHNPKIIVHGDATGRGGDSRGDQSDYDIIEYFLANYVRKDGLDLDYDIDVPKQNPRIRARHNDANGQLLNAKGVVAVAVDSKCKMIDAGFTNTRLSENAGYKEDETTEGQDISTACTYGIHWCVEYEMEEVEGITLR